MDSPKVCILRTAELIFTSPSLHAEAYNCDSNRHDLVPFLRPPLTWAYNKIEAMLATMEEAEAHGTDTSTLDIYGTGMR